MLERFHYVVYIFGALLVVTGIRFLIRRDENVHPERNPIFRLLNKMVRSVPEYDGKQFFVVRDGRRYATALFLVLLAIEATDVVFAVDSIHPELRRDVYLGADHINRPQIDGTLPGLQAHFPVPPTFK